MNWICKAGARLHDFYFWQMSESMSLGMSRPLEVTGMASVKPTVYTVHTKESQPLLLSIGFLK